MRRKLQKHARAKGIIPKSDEERLKRSPRKTSPSPEKLAGGESDGAKTAGAASVQGPNPPLAGGGENGSEVVRELFKYRLEDVEESTDKPQIVTFAKARPQPGPLDKPLIRKPIKTAAPGNKPTDAPEQKTLVLETDQPASSSETPPEPELAFDDARILPPPLQSLSGEILLSRFLAFIVDLTISVVAGFVLVFLASRASGSALPTADSLALVAGSGAVFLVLSSTFFLFATGQTWGMVCTDLRLQADLGAPPTFFSVLARTLLFFLVVATIVGLVSALFDPLRRCWHDRLTNTLVVPANISD